MSTIRKVIYWNIPEIDKELWDKYAACTPVSKMPNCPSCKEDELSMILPDEAFCNYCSAQVKRDVPIPFARNQNSGMEICETCGQPDMGCICDEN